MEFLSDPVILGYIATAVAAIWGVAKAWVYRKLKLDEVAAEAIEAGVIEVYHSYVGPLKKGKEDGKLTEEEKAEARKRAYETALKLGGNALKAKGPEWAAKAIELAVSYFKKAADK